MVQFLCTVHGNPRACQVEQDYSTWHITEDTSRLSDHLVNWIKGNRMSGLSRQKKILLGIISENHLFVFKNVDQ